MRSTYHAISIAELATLMARAGFDQVQRLDGVFFQPVLVDIRPNGG